MPSPRHDLAKDRAGTPLSPPHARPRNVQRHRKKRPIRPGKPAPPPRVPAGEGGAGGGRAGARVRGHPSVVRDGLRTARSWGWVWLARPCSGRVPVAARTTSASTATALLLQAAPDPRWCPRHRNAPGRSWAPRRVLDSARPTAVRSRTFQSSRCAAIFLRCPALAAGSTGGVASWVRVRARPGWWRSELRARVIDRSRPRRGSRAATARAFNPSRPCHGVVKERTSTLKCLPAWFLIPERIESEFTTAYRVVNRVACLALVGWSPRSACLQKAHLKPVTFFS
jgi:hypothetical protein